KTKPAGWGKNALPWHVASVASETISRILLLFCQLHRLSRRGAAVRVCPLLERQGLGPDLRHFLGSELCDLDQVEYLLGAFAFAPPADANVAEAGRVVFELLSIRPFFFAELGDHQNLFVAALGNAGLGADLVDPASVRPVVRSGCEALGVTGSIQLWLCLHHDPRSSAFEAGEPGLPADEFSVLVGLAVLTHVPDIARF